ncbi:hypothetical protein Pcac1_g6019 [Phytophthora cactorum]|uniref:Uncharacterized protein n=1 Tax=Phytophthora cactorum TaxID=29920 RepID=A0A8T1C6V8_9STRA|nr:hypothetical protein Pcac1_g6019 [Phytophthora cactorum]KAG2915630.1 hypothetical protein PC117_g17957 [Phytophthora cactorum]KAG3178849.1 hypothetical protein PC128_g16195 [Phytophthora cactorum]
MDEVEVSVSYASGAYVTGFLILLVGVVLPMVYMVLQNKKAFKAKIAVHLTWKKAHPRAEKRRAIGGKKEK